VTGWTVVVGVLEAPGRRVVVGVDCSPESEQVLRWADRQAELTRSVLIAVTGWQPDLPGVDVDVDFPEAQSRMRIALAETINAALSPERARVAKLRVSMGSPVDALLVQARRADLVVVGPRGAGGIAGLLLGSVAERVVSGASCPVAIVHAIRHRRTHRIVVRVDGSDCSRRALEWAIRQSGIVSARVDVLTVQDERSRWLLPPYESWATPKQWVDQVLAEVLEDVQPPERARISTQVCPGNAAQVLVDASAASDMIVIGNHGTGAALSRLLGSVSQKVARHAGVPVVVVHDHDHRPVPG
jgi:nucleotide-binding universal stress UspA family protein